jgi:hypothetical protein
MSTAKAAFSSALAFVPVPVPPTGTTSMSSRPGMLPDGTSLPQPAPPVPPESLAPPAEPVPLAFAAAVSAAFAPGGAANGSRTEPSLVRELSTPV